jgi:hypothetical protein
MPAIPTETMKFPTEITPLLLPTGYRYFSILTITISDF